MLLAILWFVAGALTTTAVFLSLRRSKGRGRNLRARADALRGAPKGLPSASVTGEPHWPVAEKQCQVEAEFGAFVLLLNNHEAPVTDLFEAYKRALRATLQWHGEDPEHPPTAEIFDILHREDPAAPSG